MDRELMELETMTTRTTSADDLLSTIAGEVDAVLGRISRDELAELAATLDGAPRVFVTGEGRSGFMARAFAMRLMHLGLTVHVVGETTTPSVRAGDLVVAVSGSGTTQATVHVAGQAAGSGATVWAVTTDRSSPLAGSAAGVLMVPAATKHRRRGEPETLQPLSSLFDQAVHLSLDAVCLELARLRQIDNAAAKRAHANTE